MVPLSLFAACAAAPSVPATPGSPAVSTADSAVGCREAGCQDAIQLAGLPVEGVFDTVACSLESPLTPWGLDAAIASWCDGPATTSTASGYSRSELSTCTDGSGATFWREERVSFCCTDTSRGYEWIWDADGVLVYAREWLPGSSWHWCCCGEAVPEAVFGAAPALVCTAPDATVCP